jgi:hypothetical protein
MMTTINVQCEAIASIMRLFFPEISEHRYGLTRPPFLVHS